MVLLFCIFHHQVATAAGLNITTEYCHIVWVSYNCYRCHFPEGRNFLRFFAKSPHPMNHHRSYKYNLFSTIQCTAMVIFVFYHLYITRFICFPRLLRKSSSSFLFLPPKLSSPLQKPKLICGWMGWNQKWVYGHHI